MGLPFGFPVCICLSHSARLPRLRASPQVAVRHDAGKEQRTCVNSGLRIKDKLQRGDAKTLAPIELHRLYLTMPLNTTNDGNHDNSGDENNIGMFAHCAQAITLANRSIDVVVPRLPPLNVNVNDALRDRNKLPPPAHKPKTPSISSLTTHLSISDDDNSIPGYGGSSGYEGSADILSTL